MPTAQSSSSSSTQQQQQQVGKSKGGKNAKSVDNKIAKAAAKVAEASSSTQTSSQDNTRAATPDQQSQNVGAQHSLQAGGNKTPQEQPEFIKQALIIIEKKVRNLEKRRVGF